MQAPSLRRIAAFTDTCTFAQVSFFFFAFFGFGNALTSEQFLLVFAGNFSLLSFFYIHTAPISTMHRLFVIPAEITSSALGYALITGKAVWLVGL
jgi:hypothetical protein